MDHYNVWIPGKKLNNCRCKTTSCFLCNVAGQRTETRFSSADQTLWVTCSLLYNMQQIKRNNVYFICYFWAVFIWTILQMCLMKVMRHRDDGGRHAGQMLHQWCTEWREDAGWASLVINGFVKSSQSNKQTWWLPVCGGAQIPSPV